MADSMNGFCPTFVTATSVMNSDGPSVIFRSYGCQGFNANKCTIWQAGRAMTAAPSIFKPMFIETSAPGATYIDGGIGHNNPAILVLDEARRIFSIIKRF